MNNPAWKGNQGKFCKYVCPGILTLTLILTGVPWPIRPDQLSLRPPAFQRTRMEAQPRSY